MLLILLNDLFRVRVKLQYLLVGASGKENVLLVFSRMELDAKRSPAVCKAPDHFTGLSIPQIDEFVKASTQEAAPIVRIAYVSHGLLVTFVCANALSVC